MPAIDFFHVDCAVTLRRLYVLIALEVDDRYLHVGAAIAEEDPPWLALRDHYCLDSIRSSMSREGTARQAVAGVADRGRFTSCSSSAVCASQCGRNPSGIAMSDQERAEQSSRVVGSIVALS
jgi:hypothetical protein